MAALLSRCLDLSDPNTVDQQHQLSLDDVIGRANAFCILDNELASLVPIDKVGAVNDGSLSGLFRGEGVTNLVLKLGDLTKLLQPLKLNGPIRFPRRVENAAVDLLLFSPVLVWGSLAFSLDETGPGAALRCS
jgi:hypothetical protein